VNEKKYGEKRVEKMEEAFPELSQGQIFAMEQAFTSIDNLKNRLRSFIIEEVNRASENIDAYSLSEIVVNSLFNVITWLLFVI
jgi:uncharacterized protein YjaG (DUF416 family)